MFRFGSPNILYLLFIIPVLIGVFILVTRARRKRLSQFGERATLLKLIPDSSPRRIRNKFILFVTALTLIILGIARPQFGSKLKEVSKEGIEIMFAVDVSNSMLAQDFEPNRLERTKFAINRLLESINEDKVGLIVFAGDAYVQLPITSDYIAARNFTRQISPNMVSKQGTAIGAAINLAVSSFSSESEGSRVIILISDGENHEDDAIGAAHMAAERGIKIFTIGIGTTEGVPISINGDFIKDKEGNMVVTKLDEKTLEQIALVTDGAYIRASNKSLGLNEIIDRINETEKTEFSMHTFDEFNEQYQYLLAAGIILLIINMLMLSRKNHILSRFNIFKSSDKL